MDFERMKKGFSKRSVFSIGLYIVFFVLMVLVISYKANYHIDETLSYGLGNYNKGYLFLPEEGFKYEPASEPFIEYLSCQPGNRSNFAPAWANQANDSHPPFYYALVHLVCALRPGTFSKWYAGSINIVFALLSLFVLRRITELLTENKNIRDLVSVGFILNYAIVSDSALFRMYYMSLFLVALTTYLILLQVIKDRKLLFYISIFITVYTGALTHYYCLLFDIFISFVYCINLLIKKKWKDVLLYCLCMALAAAATITTFPPIIGHLFSTGHAKDAFNGITMIADYFSRILVCFRAINNSLFGRMLYFILPILIVAYVKNKINNAEEGHGLFRYILVPSLLFFLTVSITATYTNERYFTPIFGVSYFGLYCMMFIYIEKHLKNKKNFLIVSLILIVLSVSISYVNAEWPYLYRQDVEYLNNAEKHKDTDCICIHNELKLTWEIQLNFNEFIKYKSLTVFDQRLIETEKLKNYIVGDDIVINLTCVDNEEEYIKEILSTLPQFTSYEEIGGNGNGISYYLY